MSAWTPVRLDTVAQVVRGVTYAKGDVIQKPAGEDIPILRAGNINGRLIIDDDLVWLSKALVSQDQVLRRDDIVMCMSSGSASIVGKSALLDTDWAGSFGAFCAAVRAKKARAEPRFLAHVFQGAEFRKWASAAQGNNIKNLNKSALEGYILSLPPLEEQRRILGLLDRAAEVRRRASAARASARAIIPALFLEMFGDPATNPKGWPVGTLSDLLSAPLSYGSMVSPQAGSDAWRDIRVVNIQDSRINHANTKYVQLDDQSIAKHSLQDGDIVMARAIGSEKHLGKCAVVWPRRERWAYDSHVMRIRVDLRLAHPVWLHAFMCSEGGKTRLLSRARASAIQHNINTKEVAAALVSLPPLALQAAFAEQAQRLEAIARSLESAAAKGAAMAAALSAEVFAHSTAKGNCHAGAKAGQ